MKLLTFKSIGSKYVFSTSNATTAPRYHYDPKGRRVAKTTGQGAQQTTTWYVYAEEGLIAEINEQGQTQKSYGWEPDSPWGTKILWQADHGSAATKTYHYIHSDHLGTPQIATDKNGNQTWAQVSEAFGKATISANASTEINIRFPGQYYDKETGTHYNFHRDYDPSTGRYLQSDPIGLRGGINMFSYTNNSPINFFDELGLKARMCCRAIPATLNIAYHCFIDIQDNDPSECPTCPPVTGRGSTSLHGPCGLGSGDCDRRGGEVFIGRPGARTFDNPAQSVCGGWNTDCQVDECVVAAARAYEQDSEYGIWRRNSNSFAFYVARSCGITSFPPTFNPGQDDGPSGPAYPFPDSGD
ncbi:RHS repeat domain-containing protein [Vandammella animalimorsus]|uniref:RHS repeat domain-containing protein n=1 Tax=Vandammella animalimorsus TaxID=2029117 RepID=UPI0015578347|nr:RHS repeat-associated core domain-containing protein [Vandammella animalimorsus]